MSNYQQHGGRHKRIVGSDPTPGIVYVDDRILDEPTDSVVFTGFASDADPLAILEFTWHLTLDAGTASGDDSLIFLLMNGDSFGSTEYFWKLAGSVTLDTSTDSGGALGYLAASKFGWGRVRFPNYNGDFDTGPSPIGDGPPWIGEGGWALTNGDSGDLWLTHGYREAQDNPGMTQLEIVCYTVDGLTQQTFGAPSRLTVTGY